MTQNILISGAFLLSALCGFIFIPLIMRFCKNKGLYDHPDARKVHRRNIPRLGGISFMPSMMLASLVFIMINRQGSFEFSNWSLMFFICLLLIYGVGIVDDLVGLDAKTKFSVQTLAALLLPLAGLYINNFYGLFGIHEVPYYVGFPLTMFVIVFVCNAINLIDGIDGLSAGLSFIALAGFLYFFQREQFFYYSILIAGLMGVLIAFLYFNIFGKAEKNKKIFMGDSGSLTLGFILGFLSVKYSMHHPETSPLRPDSLMQASSLLIVPAFDVVRVTLVRFCHHTPLFQADKNHVHHKLMRSGLTQHQALCCILLLALGYIVLNMLILPLIGHTATVLVDVIVWLIFHFVVNRQIQKKGQPVFLPNKE
jgi:UDP-N-acetylmuramyl pentapeptide phosphotransferase/UDP-N-acetylglucosamine-1-phosphate transferase